MKSIKLTTNERIENERLKLTKQFESLDSRIKSIAEKAIYNAAFMAITLDDISKTISEKGFISEYQNGENQWGTKKSPEIEIYNQTMSNYLKTIKQLTDLMPDNLETYRKDDDLEAIQGFIKNG